MALKPNMAESVYELTRDELTGTKEKMTLSQYKTKCILLTIECTIPMQINGVNGQYFRSS